MSSTECRKISAAALLCNDTWPRLDQIVQTIEDCVCDHDQDDLDTSGTPMRILWSIMGEPV